MPAATEVQAATLQKFIKGWGEWTPDFLSSWSDDLAFTPLPFSMGKPTRPREKLEPLYLRLISTLKNYQVSSGSCSKHRFVLTLEWSAYSP